MDPSAADRDDFIYCMEKKIYNKKGTYNPWQRFHAENRDSTRWIIFNSSLYLFDAQ